MAEWYYVHNGEQVGPVSGSQLKALAAQGVLSREDLVWSQALPEWTAAKRIRGLSFSGQGAPAPVETSGPSEEPPTEQAPAPDEFEAPAHQEEQAYFEPATELPAPTESAAPAEAAPALSYQAPGGAEYDAASVSPLSIDYLRQTKPWVRLFSVLMFIGAGFLLLAVLGLLLTGGGGMLHAPVIGIFVLIGAIIQAGVALLYLFPAIFLWRYASRIGLLMRSGSGHDLDLALEAQRSFWRFVGIVTASFIGLYLLMVLVLVLVGVMHH